ncbi:MAG: ECF transporter S component [Clostridiales bacterium]|nr:ECF transporter S component [Clostridiales bacterium]
MAKRIDRTRTLKLVQIALITAIVIVLQLVGASIRLGTFSVSLVLVPIVIGAILYGPIAGAWLGLVFGVTVLLSGDASLFLGFSPAGTIITVLLKGILAGFVSGVVYKSLSKWKKYPAVIITAAVCPIVNTGVFLLGCFTFFYKYLPDIGSAIGLDSIGSPFAFVITVLIGLNFVFEVILNVALAPVIVRITDLGKKALAKRSK